MKKIMIGLMSLVTVVYASAPAGRYTDEKGSQVTTVSTQIKDTVTGLIWQKGSGSAMNWNQAWNYCNTLAISSQGSGSWRLPGVKELSTLMDVGVSAGSEVDRTAFPNTPTDSPFWSFESYQPNAGFAWTVNFGTGEVTPLYVSASNYVRCVRSPTLATPAASVPLPVPVSKQLANWKASTGVYDDPAVSGSRFSTVVADSYTGLQWEAQSSSITYTWDPAGSIGSAQYYCSHQRTGGYNDWRLPTVEELLTLVDYSHVQPVVDGSFFSNTCSGSSYWSAISGGASVAWAVGCLGGWSSTANINTQLDVRCVRN
ncbi:MAG: DUF1566 domain-containing protein [Myxococcaceae bacterium]